MADTNLKTTMGSPHRYSSASISIRECTASGGSVLTSWFIMPYCDGLGLSRAAEESELKDGTNAVIAKDAALTNYKLKGNFLQCNKTVVDLINSSTGKYYNVHFMQGVVNGQYVEWMMPLCKLGGNFDMDLADWNKIPFEISSVDNAAQIVMTTSLPSLAKATTFTITTNSQVVITETTVT